ncbi:6-carboxytetrahydropterin synthase QueD [Lentisphaerota bacterium ZTH]|nr:6-carboxytetrahydropterin synthase QueD [Lentisphaerota bacterium]WET07058.1 6-carboxytetrahydropterin synthase QueD [Lentisphaerota bacterium ZTH]
MFEVDICRSFSAAHFLRGYKGDCSTLHGHNWTVQAYLRAEKLDEIGIACDFKKIKRELDTIIEEYDHTNLSEHPDFVNSNTTSEIIAKTIFERLAEKLNDDNLKVHRVRIGESPGSGATYFLN